MAAGGPDMSCAGHAQPGSAKAKNVAICHNPACDAIRFDTHTVDRYIFVHFGTALFLDYLK